MLPGILALGGTLGIDSYPSVSGPLLTILATVPASGTLAQPSDVIGCTMQSDGVHWTGYAGILTAAQAAAVQALGTTANLSWTDSVTGAVQFPGAVLSGGPGSPSAPFASTAERNAAYASVLPGYVGFPAYLPGGVRTEWAGPTNTDWKTFVIPKPFQSIPAVFIEGDSISSQSSSSGLWDALQISSSSFALAKNQSVFGSKIADVTARFNPSGMMAADKIFLMVGTNDDTMSLVQFAAAYSNLVTLFLSVGVPLYLFACAPKNSNIGLLSAFRQIQKKVAEKNCCFFGDPWTSCINPLTGGWNSGDSGDGVHPATAAVAKAVTTLISELNFSVTPSGYAGPINQSAPIGIFANQLFQTDTNADGLADGVTKYGSGGIATLVAGNIGNRQVLTGNSQLYFGIYQLGGAHTVDISFYLNYAPINSALSIYLEYKDAVGNAISSEIMLYVRNTVAGWYQSKRTLPAGATGFDMTMSYNDLGSGGASVLGLEQMSIIDLTALGIA